MNQSSSLAINADALVIVLCIAALIACYTLMRWINPKSHIIRDGELHINQQFYDVHEREAYDKTTRLLWSHFNRVSIAMKNGFALFSKSIRENIVKSYGIPAHVIDASQQSNFNDEMREAVSKGHIIVIDARDNANPDPDNDPDL